MKGPKRTVRGKSKRANKRSAALFDRLVKQVVSCVWDFANDGGALGDYVFRTQLPAGAVVTAVWTDEQTAVTGNTSATLKAGSTALTGAIDFTGDSGVQSRALAGAVAAIKPSATVGNELTLTLATAVATAGKIRFSVEFFVSES